MKKLVTFVLIGLFLVFLLANVFGENSNLINTKLAQQFSSSKIITEEDYYLGNNQEVIVGVNSLEEENFVKSLGKNEKIREDLFVVKTNSKGLNKLLTKDIEVFPNKEYSVLMDEVVNIVEASDSWMLQKNSQNLTGLHQTICIIDTGINYNHSDLGGCFGNNDENSSCKVIGGWNTFEDNSNLTDLNGHGTHVSGIASSNGTLKGVAPDSKIIFIKAFDDNSGSFSTADIIQAIDWCVANSTKFNISVISMSLGVNCTTQPEHCSESYCNNEPEKNSINSAFAKNISVVIASGNDYSSNLVSSPACIENATAVTSTNKVDTNISEFANTWNDSSLMILASPGENVNSTYKNNNYAIASGTSMATPGVAGAIAILRQYGQLDARNYTPSEIETTLNETGKQIYDSYANRYFSRINVYDSLVSLGYNDSDTPNISEVSISVSSSSATLTWATTENTNVSITSGTNITNSIFSSTHSEIISGLSASTFYDYNLTFCDRAGNCNSTLGNFTTSAAEVRRSSGGGGSSKRVVVPIIPILEMGKVQTVSLNETKKFSFSGVNHTLKVNELGENFANITIQSEPINFVLAVGEEKRINLSSSKYFDLGVKLESISENKLNLTLRVIYEPIVTENKTEIHNESERILIPLEIKEETEEKNNLVWIILAIFVILAAVIERKLNQKRLKTKSTFKEYEKTKA